MTEPITVDVVNGTYTCPDHPEVGPILLGYEGDTPPAKVSVTHDDEGLHHATPVEGEAPAAAEEQGESPTDEGGNGGEGDGAGAATQQGDGSPETPSEGDDGSAGQ